MYRVRELPQGWGHRCATRHFPRIFRPPRSCLCTVFGALARRSAGLQGSRPSPNCSVSRPRASFRAGPIDGLPARGGDCADTVVSPRQDPAGNRTDCAAGKTREPIPPTVDHSWGVRPRYTPSSVFSPAAKGLSRRERFLRPRQLRLTHDLRRRPVILLDDVVTTGSTLEACARVIREHGAEVVAAVVLAATPRSGRSAVDQSVNRG